jgi:hypothetical protein
VGVGVFESALKIAVYSSEKRLYELDRQIKKA